MGVGSDEQEKSSLEMNPELKVTFTTDSDNQIQETSEHELMLSDQEQPTIPSQHNEDAHFEHSFSEGDFHRMIASSLQGNTSRRSSLPAGILEHGAVNNLCGKILRFMGDEHFSKTCGKHLRCMGDEICYSYLLRNIMSNQNVAENEHHIANSQSLPDLTHFSSDKNK